MKKFIFFVMLFIYVGCGGVSSVSKKQNKSNNVDKIYYYVKNMTAEICLVNPDRTSNKITYKYENNTNKEITKNGYRKNGRLCFKVPLKYDRVHNFKIKQLDGRYISRQIVIDRLPTNFVRIKMTFNCDSDVDLHILEPKVNPNCKKTYGNICKKGREIYFNNRRNYGELDVDSRSKNEGPENYVLDTTTAVKGRYYYWIEWYSRKDNFKKYYNKTCSGNLEIVENGQVKNIPFSFFNVSYTSNRQRQIKFSTYPANKKDFYFKIR